AKQVTDIKEFLEITRRKDAKSKLLKKALMSASSVLYIGEVVKFTGILTSQHTRLGIRVKKNGNLTKFKVRCSRFLYTMCIKDGGQAKKLREAFPPGMY
ncbi:60S ribosomal protein L38, partial [Spiromyces aspiralis]